MGLGVGEVLFEEPLARWTAFACGGTAEALVRVDDPAGLGTLLDWCRRIKVKVKVIGRSHGMVFRGGGLDGVAVVAAGMDDVVAVDDTTTCPDTRVAFAASAGATLARVARIAAEHGASAPTGLAGSMATVGGAVRRCYPALAEHVDAVILVSERGKRSEKRSEELGEVQGPFPVKNRWAVAGVRFCFKRSGDLFSGNPTVEGLAMPEGAVGSIRLFEDMPEATASEVLDTVAARGIRLRDVAIHDQDANLAVNLGEGTVNDLQLLTRYVKERAKKGAGVELRQAYRVNGKKRQT